MSIHYKFGLVDGALLNEDELKQVLSRMQVQCITERIEGHFYDVFLDDGGLTRDPTDSGVVDMLLELWNTTPGDVGYGEAAQAELCVLVPGAKNPEFRIARRIEGVPGFAFKDLDAARLELEKAGALPEPIRHLRRASDLGVVVVFGERDTPASAFGDIE